MQIHIAPGDGAPIYQQIVRQVTLLVATGRLAPGEELPPIRSLAEQLKINPNTVARAYRELEQSGVVTKKKTAGTYVSESSTLSPLAKKERVRLLTERIDALLAEARQMGIETHEVVGLLLRRDEAMNRSKPRPGGDRDGHR